MQLVVSSDDVLMEELLFHGKVEGTEIIRVEDGGGFIDYPDADGYIDLQFSNDDTGPVNLTKPLIINYVAGTLEGFGKNVIRINGWKSFLKRELVEASCRNEEMCDGVEKIFACLNRKMAWTPDVPGFISARIIAMIINEAHFSLEEGVSDKKAIDTAMKLGTNYPFGPFEWSELIGLKNIKELLMKLGKEQSRYLPCDLIQKEIKS